MIMVRKYKNLIEEFVKGCETDSIFVRENDDDWAYYGSYSGYQEGKYVSITAMVPWRGNPRFEVSFTTKDYEYVVETLKTIDETVELTVQIPETAYRTEKM